MRSSIWLFMSCVVGCAEPAFDEIRQDLGPPPLITYDSCTPAAGSYLSCEQALSAAGTTSGCFTILSHGFASQPVARNCTLDHVLVLQVYDGTTAPGTDQTYLDTVLDSLTTFVDNASYGRAVLDLEIAGTASTTAARWFSSASSQSAQLAQLTTADSLHALDYYDSFVILSTESKRGVEVSCDVTVNGTTTHPPCATTYDYRATSDPTGVSTSVHHEFGHALGLKHDHSLSSASGYNATRTTFDGEQIEYGGRASVMGTNTDALYDLPERVKLGWLNDGTRGGGRHVVEVDGTGSPVDQTVTFDTLVQDVEALKGVYVPTTNGNYWIEARRDAVMDPILRTGVILHFSGNNLLDNRMLDGTPETPGDALVDGTLPIGRTFADPVNRVYITARSETSTSATVEIQRDPVDPNPPVITAVTATNCTLSPAACPGLPAAPAGTDYWKYAVTATDADGDPLSYSWRFGIGTNGVANSSSYQAGAIAFRLQSRLSPPWRAFVTVSDRKGGEATGFVNQTGYRSQWVGPSLAGVGLVIVPVDPDNVRADNELRFETTADPTGTELLDYQWTVDGGTYAWNQPIVEPDVFAVAGATAPTCINASLRVTDTSNCSAEPTACTTSTATTCVNVPLRLSWVAILGPNGLPSSFNIQLSADTVALFNGTPTITWTPDPSAPTCTVTVAPSNLSATMPAPGCKVTVTLATKNKKYAVTAVPN